MTPLRSFSAALVLLSALASTAVGAPAAQQPPATKPGDQPGSGPADKAENRVVTSEPIHAVVLPMKGSYDQHQAAFEKLAGYLTGRGVSPAGAPFARYFSDPSAGEAALLWEVGLPVAAGVTVEAPFELKDVPASHRGPRASWLVRGAGERLARLRAVDPRQRLPARGAAAADLQGRLLDTEHRDADARAEVRAVRPSGRRVAELRLSPSE